MNFHTFTNATQGQTIQGYVIMSLNFTRSEDLSIMKKDNMLLKMLNFAM